jgi:O-acetyl-ADP-ribose deacetylase (regulator of RNase III)
MITYKTGNILTEDVEAIVNTVNCVGVMGRGIALQFKKAFPKNFNAYAIACKQGQVKPGKMFVYETGGLSNPKFIINFPTKRHWKGKSRIEDIASGLRDLIEVVNSRNIKSIAVPPLGSGLGGLEWNHIKPLIEESISSIEGLELVVYEPGVDVNDSRAVRNKKVPHMTSGRAALLELIDRYLKGLLDPIVTLLEAHKLMYFMQEAGEELKLKFAEAPYGPYAENLRHVFNAIEGHMIAGYADGGDNPFKQITLVPGAIDDAKAFLEHHDDTKSRFGRVADLVEGFESPLGLELLSTVHWAAKQSDAASSEEVVSYVHHWSERKQQFTPRQIELALHLLSTKGWINSVN